MRGKSKYGNVKSGGHASKKEAARAATLKLLEKAGKIKDLQEQVTYTLIPAQFEGRVKTGTAWSLPASTWQISCTPTSRRGKPWWRTPRGSALTFTR